MMDYANICYKKNFLTTVVLRLDFVSPLLELTTELPKEVSEKILRYFPIKEPKSAYMQKLKLEKKKEEKPKVSAETREFTEWNFFGRNREKQLTLTTDFFLIQYTKYQTYEQLYNEFKEISAAFFQKYHEVQANRLGLRYINEIEVNEDNPLDWKKYIDSSLLGLFSITIQNSKTIRIFHNYEIVHDEGFNLRFQFGIHNPDYPAQIKRKVFVMDCDAYFQGLVEPQDIATNVNKYHSAIQMMFENNITSELRKKMNES